MRVEQERRDTKGSNGDPEVDEVWRPNRHRNIEQHDERPHPEIDTGTCKSREEDAERNPSRSKATACSDVSSTPKC